MSNRATYDITVEKYKCFKCSESCEADDIVWADVEGQIVKLGNDTAWCVSCLPSEKEKKMDQPLEVLVSSMTRVMKDAYETGYSYGSRETREEIIAKVEKRRKDIENLERDTTELVILLAMLKADRL